MSISTKQVRFELTAKDKTKLAFKNTSNGLQTIKKNALGLSKTLSLMSIGGIGAVTFGLIRMANKSIDSGEWQVLRIQRNINEIWKRSMVG